MVKFFSIHQALRQALGLFFNPILDLPSQAQVKGGTVVKPTGALLRPLSQKTLIDPYSTLQVIVFLPLLRAGSLPGSTTRCLHLRDECRC